MVRGSGAHQTDLGPWKALGGFAPPLVGDTAPQTVLLGSGLLGCLPLALRDCKPSEHEHQAASRAFATESHTFRGDWTLL